jgi:hypothetical protein
MFNRRTQSFEFMTMGTPSHGPAAAQQHAWQILQAHAHGEVLGSMHAEHMKNAWRCLDATSQQ